MYMHKKLTKVILPVAGFGTRFLPATKASPKEMLPIVDKPLIQYAVEEAVSAGFKEIIFITSNTKRAIEDHFDTNYELETKLNEKGEQSLLEKVQGILPNGTSCCYIRQHEAKGLGHAILQAAPVIGDEPFAVILADDLIYAPDSNALQQMSAVYEATQKAVIGIQEVADSEVSRYGIVGLSQSTQHVNCALVESMVEKPKPGLAPSNLAAIGRYILTSELFESLANTKPGAGNEIQLTDALHTLIDKKALTACLLQGKRYDCGNKLEYLKAMVEYGLRHEEVGQAFADYLQNTHG